MSETEDSATTRPVLCFCNKLGLLLADAQHLFVKIPSVYSKNYAHGKALLGFVGV